MHGGRQHERLECGDVEQFPAPAVTGREAVNCGEHPGQPIPQSAACHQRRPVDEPALGQTSGQGLECQIGGGPPRPWTGEAEVGDGRDDGVRRELPNPFGRQCARDGAIR